MSGRGHGWVLVARSACTGTGRWFPVIGGTLGSESCLQARAAANMLRHDRRCDGETLPREQVVRVPLRVVRDLELQRTARMLGAL